jgi:hypothetical protein
MNARDREQLRQEREAFEQVRRHGASWFRLRLIICYAIVLMLYVSGAVSSYILLHPVDYSAEILGVAATTLLVDMVAMAATTFRLVLRRDDAFRLKPITRHRP